MVSASTCSRTMFSLDSCKKCNSKVRKFKIFKNKSQTVKGTSVNTSSISIMRIVVLLLMILTETSSKVTSTSTSKMLLLWPRFVCVLVPSFIHLRPCPTIFIPTTLMRHWVDKGLLILPPRIRVIVRAKIQVVVIGSTSHRPST